MALFSTVYHRGVHEYIHNAPGYVPPPPRDLKPENCMLSEQGHIVLTDFGSAKMLDVAEKTSSLAGTPQYIAPEVLRGEPYSWSADWWSCGILLHEMLTGKVTVETCTHSVYGS